MCTLYILNQWTNEPMNQWTNEPMNTRTQEHKNTNNIIEYCFYYISIISDDTSRTITLERITRRIRVRLIFKQAIFLFAFYNLDVYILTVLNYFISTTSWQLRKRLWEGYSIYVWMCAHMILWSRSSSRIFTFAIYDFSH